MLSLHRLAIVFALAGAADIRTEFLRHMFPHNRHIPDEILKGEHISPRVDIDNVDMDVDQDLSPVVMVGGLTSSKIWADMSRTEHKHFYCVKNYKNYTLWLDSKEFYLPFENDCWSDDARLRWEKVSGSATIREVDVGVRSFLPGDRFYPMNSTGPGTEGFQLDLYSPLVGNFTTRLGYSPTQRGYFYYDFRRGPNEYAVDGTFQTLKDKVEIYYNQSKPTSGGTAKRVVLISCSMGGPVTHQFFNWIDMALGAAAGKAWKAKYIERWISSSGVFGGTSEMISTTVRPDNADMYNAMVTAWWIDWDGVRDMIASWAGTQMMQPQFFSDGDTVLQEWYANGSYSNFTIMDLPEVFSRAGGLPTAGDVYEAQQVWNFANLNPPGVEVDCLYGVNLTTSRTFRYEHGLMKPPIVMENGTGDSVVNVESLSLCNKWTHMDTSNRVNKKEFNSSRHAWELFSEEGIDFIIDILMGIRDKNRVKSIYV